MHTTETPNYICHHNGDFSGDVECQPKSSAPVISMPFIDMLALVAAYVRRQRISAIEEMDDCGVLGLSPDNPQPE